MATKSKAHPARGAETRKRDLQAAAWLGQELPAIAEEAWRQAAAAIPGLRELRDRMRIKRGGKAFSESELNAALQDARAAHERGN